LCRRFGRAGTGGLETGRLAYEILADNVPGQGVSERLGHARPTVTLTVYQHVHPGMGRQAAADLFAALLRG
jgi:hypothetical protein